MISSKLYPYANINLRSITSESFKFDLLLPDKKLPKNVLFEDENLIIKGYFISFEDDFSWENGVSYIQNAQYKKLITPNSDFLLLIFRKKEKVIEIITSPSGNFPLYFAFENGRLLFSTEFGLVLKQLSEVELDVKGSLDFVTMNEEFTAGPLTIVSNINKLPPATLLSIKADSCHLRPIFRASDFNDRVEEKPFEKIEEFRTQLLCALQESVLQRLKTIQPLSYASDISSGLDSSLVSYLVKTQGSQRLCSYSILWRHFMEQADPAVIDIFARKHDLDVKYFDLPEDITLSEEELFWVKERFYPVSRNIVILNNYFKRIKECGEVDAIFEGSGGDEAYVSYLLNDQMRFQVQFGYYNSVLRLIYNGCLENIFTDRGRNELLNQDRFRQKDLFVTPTPVAVTLSQHQAFAIYWENNIWPLLPFMDTRVINVCRRIPKVKGKYCTKLDVWKDDKEIFVKEQLKQKTGISNLYNRIFLITKKRKIIDILKNSVLEKYGWLKTEEIINNLRNSYFEPYENDSVATVLLRYLRLEYFLQNNNVILP
jgi:asparagine synthetase B (glutamine-hydrolysing)